MPSRERVAQLVQRVERGEFVEALQEFYAEDASTQENEGAPRQGRALLIANERQLLAVMRVRTLPCEAWFVDGDRAVIHWQFEFTDANGRCMQMDELALQQWRGEHIVQERFYYDPAQRNRWT
ncbi:MAG TPA: nuclear transport factor 2 family protein [Nevskia sp.]|jgi:hypothetical protein|nr:nuclear transport factor 2 family protein [Nevskia sp.]